MHVKTIATRDFSFYTFKSVEKYLIMHVKTIFRSIRSKIAGINVNDPISSRLSVEFLR